MRHRIYIFPVLGACLIIFGCGSLIDSLINRVEEEGEAVIPSESSLALHNTLLIADLHADPLLLGRDLLAKSKKAHVDIPRLILGNVALQGFGVVTKVPGDIVWRRFNLSVDSKDDLIRKLAKILDWPEDTHESLMARSLYLAGELHAFEVRSSGSFRIIKSQADLRAYLVDRQKNREMTAGFLSLEGAHTLEGCVKNVEVLSKAGFRVIGLTHFFDNEVGGSVHGVGRGGLTEFGREVIKEIGHLHLIVDLAHASEKLIDDVLTFIDSMPVNERPALLVSHTGVQETCPSKRNLTDKQLRRIVEVQKDALIGIGFFESAICGKQVKHIVDAIRHVVDLVGIRHAALGSDWDGFGTMPMDAENLAKLTHRLSTSGFSPDSIERIMGLNTVEFLERALPPN